MKEAISIDKIRGKIDAIDEQLLQLLNDRMEWVKAIGEIKKSSNSTIYRPEREKAIIQKLSSMNTGKLNQQAIEAIFLEVFAVSRNIELPEKIAYLGPDGSFTHQAAEARFGAMSEYIPLKNIQAVFEAVITGRVRYGLVPIENNQQGIVGETVKLLSDSDINIVAEVPMAIHFSFAALNEDVKSIKKIYSKDIAFDQCGEFIADYLPKDVELIPIESTSKAAKMASMNPEAAALCSHIAAKMYGLPILFDNVEDSPNNHTRFLIISDQYKNSASGNDKTTILAKNSGHPGSLVEFLQQFHTAGINLLKIESYPAKEGKKFKYWFLIEFDGHCDDSNVRPIMERNQEVIKWLGSYSKLC